MNDHQIVDVIIIGAGQAGLSTSYLLKENGISHVVFERNRIGDSWQKRWDSFRLNSPHQYNLLPGEAPGSNRPDDFTTAQDFVNRLVNFAHTRQLPVIENANVVSLQKSSIEDSFIVDVIQNGQHVSWSSKQVVVASGGENNASFPDISELVPDNII